MDCLGITLKDVRKHHKTLSSEEQVSLARRWQNYKDYDAREKLIQSVLPWAIRLAQLLHVKTSESYSSNVQLDDLISAAFEGVIHSVDKFDPEVGCKLTTYATWWIKQSMWRYLTNNWSDIHVPVYIHKHIKAFFELDVDDKLDVVNNPGHKKVSCALNAMHSVESLSKYYEVDGKQYQYSDMFLSTDNEPFQNVVEKEDLAFLEECITRLDSRKQFVVRERLRGKTLQQVAEIIGVTRERVRQIQISAEKKIKEYFGTHE